MVFSSKNMVSTCLKIWSFFWKKIEIVNYTDIVRRFSCDFVKIFVFQIFNFSIRFKVFKFLWFSVSLWFGFCPMNRFSGPGHFTVNYDFVIFHSKAYFRISRNHTTEILWERFEFCPRLAVMSSQNVAKSFFWKIITIWPSRNITPIINWQVHTHFSNSFSSFFYHGARFDQGTTVHPWKKLNRRESTGRMTSQVQPWPKFWARLFLFKTRFGSADFRNNKFFEKFSRRPTRINLKVTNAWNHEYRFYIIYIKFQIFGEWKIYLLRC